MGGVFVMQRGCGPFKEVLQGVPVSSFLEERLQDGGSRGDLPFPLWDV
jgi:hypothetical protein